MIRRLLVVAPSPTTYSGIAVSPPESISTRFGTSMSAHHILGLKKVPRVWLFAIKVVRSWVQNVVFGPYPLWA